MLEWETEDFLTNQAKQDLQVKSVSFPFLIGADDGSQHGYLRLIRSKIRSSPFPARAELKI